MWIPMIKELLRAERTIKEYRMEQEWQKKRNITLIAVGAFLVMSLLNIYQHSAAMLMTTLGACAALLAGLAIGWKNHNARAMEIALFCVVSVLMSSYVLFGGNNGFALLWVIFVPFLFMLMVDLKMGLILSVYFFLLLFLVFYGPLDFLLQYDYDPTTRLRFPALYLIDCALSFYSVRELITARDELIQAQQELRRISLYDPATGLKNRAAYTEYAGRQQTGEQLAVVYIDVNGLHEVNNSMGHKAGDELLRTVAGLCLRHLPAAEVFRLGGDEFLAISGQYTQAEVEERLAALNRDVEAHGYTISCGVEYRTGQIDLEEMTNCADAKMLKSKAEYYMGRDRRSR